MKKNDLALMQEEGKNANKICLKERKERKNRGHQCKRGVQNQTEENGPHDLSRSSSVS